MTFVKRASGGAMFRFDDESKHFKRNGRPRRCKAVALAPPSVAPPSTVDWNAEAARCAAALDGAGRDELSRDLGVTSESLAAVGAGWATRDELRAWGASGAGWTEAYPDGAYTFPERDGSGRIVGMSLRAKDGRKGSPSKARTGAIRGLIVPSTLAQHADPVLIVEGASDVATCVALGRAAVGRPSNSGGAEDLARLLRGRDVIVVGERDGKPDGRWPGRDGAQSVAARLATTWRSEVPWSLPPESVKDIRAWLTARVADGLDLSDHAACRIAGAELLSELRSNAIDAEPERQPSQSECLVRLALDVYRIGRTTTDEPFAVAIDGPNIARMFRGSREALRCGLAREYRQRCGRTPSASAIADAMTCLQGNAQDADTESVHLRVADHEGGVVIDLGDAAGRAIVVKPGAWEIVDVSPVLFRRTALTSELPAPQRGGDLGLLRDLLNVSEDTWSVVIGWLIGAFMPSIPHPILLVGGLQGTGKSTAADFLIGLFDPSPAQRRNGAASRVTRRHG